jgi:hypothetical protein
MNARSTGGWHGCWWLPGVLFCLLIQTPVLTAQDVPSHRWKQPVVLAESEVEELVSVSLTSEVYADSAASLADLRILGDDGRPTPFLIRRKPVTESKTVRTTRRAELSDVQLLADGGLECRVHLKDDDPPVTSISFVTPLKNFEQRVQVFVVSAEQDAAADVLVADELIFDYSQYLDVRRREVPLSENTGRSFRIVFGSLTAVQESQVIELTRNLRGEHSEDLRERLTVDRRPFRIDRVDLHNDVRRHSVVGEQQVQWPTETVGIHVDKETQHTVVDVKTQRQPVNQLTVNTTDQNFSRAATVVEIPSGGFSDGERTVGSSLVRRFSFKGLQEEDLSVDFSASRAPGFRVTIDNRDNPPLTVDSVTATGPVDELVFLAGPGRSYDLLYGADQEQKPEYDLAAIKELLNRGVEPLSGTLGVAEAVEGSAAGPDVTFWQIINNPVVLVVGIGILCGLLAWALYGASKRVEQIPDDES